MPGMARITEDQIADYQETFGLFDNKGDGKIYAHQLGDVLRAMGQNPTESEVRKCGYHSEPDFRISFETFLPILSTISKNRDTSTIEDFIEGFRVFDKEQNGMINSAELRHLLSSLGEKMTDEEVNELLMGQEDAQGNVNYEEFVKMVLNG
ncbi:Myosin-2 essential light chain [Lamellibrachia satsuma]|nr:Myosin-2 essential light chain [Lamellibrachia satsuma]